MFYYAFFRIEPKPYLPALLLLCLWLGSAHARNYAVPGTYLLYYYYFFTLLLASFWTSRGHRCRLFSPPVLAFNFYRA